MSTNIKPVKFNFLLRDAQQSLIAGREHADTYVQKAEIANRAGFDGVETFGGTRNTNPARFSGEDPFLDTLDPVSKATPDVERSMLMRGQSGNGMRIYSDEIIGLEIEVLAEDDAITTIRAFDAVNNLQNLQTVFDEGNKHPNLKIQAAMSYSLSPSRDRDFYVDLATQYIEAGADEICFKDMAGLLEPEDAAYMINAIKENHPDVPLSLHMHATSGKSQATILSAIKAGIDGVDVAVDGMSDWVGHASAQDILYLMETSDDPEISDRMPEIDLGALEEIKQLNLESRVLYRGYELPYDKDIQEAIIEAKMPGGMATTFIDCIEKNFFIGKEVSKEELKQATLEALKEVPAIAKDLGHVELVTPTSNIVCQQAACAWNIKKQFATEIEEKTTTIEATLGRLILQDTTDTEQIKNDASKQLEALRQEYTYKTKAPNFNNYVLGHLGYSTQKPDELLIEHVEEETGEKRYIGRPADLANQNELAETTELIKAALGETFYDNLSNRDVLTAIMTGDDGAGINSLKARDKNDPTISSSYEPKPEMPSFLTTETNGYSETRKDPAAARDAIGNMVPEELIQIAQKLQMIEDGSSFVGIPEDQKQQYIADIQNKALRIIATMPDQLKHAGFTDVQVTGLFNNQSAGSNGMQKYINDRAAQLGVTTERFIPKLGENPSYSPILIEQPQTQDADQKEELTA